MTKVDVFSTVISHVDDIYPQYDTMRRSLDFGDILLPTCNASLMLIKCQTNQYLGTFYKIFDLNASVLSRSKKTRNTDTPSRTRGK